jgi:alkaline phosphatase D
MSLSRRTVLRAGISAGVSATLLGVAARPSYAADLTAYPFTLGVASGDPRHNGVTLWTRLAPDPLTPGFGMDERDYAVEWRIATDEAMKHVVHRGTAPALAAEAHSVHVNVQGLAPDRHYWYQFKIGDQLSRIGRTKTFPPPGKPVRSLTFAALSCQNFPAGHYAAYRHLATQDVDLVIHLGDYIYEGAGAANPAAGRARRHAPFVTLTTLEDYRIRHAQYKLDPHLQDAHAAHPWIVVPDDHEVVNNQTIATGAARKTAGYQAYWEHMPLPASARPQGAFIQLFRGTNYGKLAAFDMLDTRQFRTPLIPGATFRELPPEAYDPARTLMGAEQEQWLFKQLDRSHARWNVLAQQVYLAAIDVAAGPGTAFNNDKWDGYPVARERVTRFLHEARPSNPIVLAGDVHAAMVNDITLTNHPSSPVVATEFLGSSVTTAKDNNPTFEDNRSENPHMIFYNGRQRGYLTCEVTWDQFRGDLWFVDDVLRADSPVRLQASYAVDAGVLGAHAL